jgi:hypothetical protein
MGQLEERRGLSVMKGEESDVDSRHLQGCSPRLYWLKANGMALVSRY